MFCAILSTANGGHLIMPNCKKSKLLHTRNILAQSWINFNQRFLRYRHFHVYAIFDNGPRQPSFHWKVYFYLILKQLNARIILTQIWSKSIKRLSRYCHFTFCAIFSNGKWLPSWNAKLQEIRKASYKKHSGTKLDRFQPMVLEIPSFSCSCYF